MAGLLRRNFRQDVMIELSWIKDTISDIADKLNIETYNSTLLKYHVEPEEEKAIEGFVFFNHRNIDNLSTEEIRQGVTAFFENIVPNNRGWIMQDHIMLKLIHLQREQYYNFK